MTCDRWQVEISAWLDEALSEAGAAALRRHLSTCTSCSHFLAVQRRLASALAAQPQLAPSPQVWQRLEFELRRRQAEARVPIPARRALRDWLRLPQWGYAAASLLLLVLSGVTAVRMQGPDRQPAELLAELDAFNIPTSGNPFMAQVEDRNPFFDPAGLAQDNPFKGGGELR